MGHLILKSRLAYSLPALDVAEFAAAVEAWCEVLTEAVPRERLNDCYLYAVRHRESTFPLAAPELLTAWRFINTAEAQERQSARPCGLCAGTGYGNVYDPKTDTEIVKECPHCHGKVVTSLQQRAAI